MFSGNINAQGGGKGAIMFSAPLPPFYTPLLRTVHDAFHSESIAPRPYLSQHPSTVTDPSQRDRISSVQGQNKTVVAYIVIRALC
jgi:hypothetical protein